MVGARAGKLDGLFAVLDWRQLNREEVQVARCTVEWLMKQLKLEGVQRDRIVKTTVADFTYVSTWQGWL